MTSSDKPNESPNAPNAPNARKVVDLTTDAKRQKAKSKARKSRAQGTTLCKRGFHKWVDEPKKQFDVKQGKLISMRRCSRCGERKTQIG